MSTRPLHVEIETGPLQRFSDDAFARWASLKIGGVTVFTELVYDIDEQGERTTEQAEQNLLRVFASKLARVLEEGA